MPTVKKLTALLVLILALTLPAIGACDPRSRAAAGLDALIDCTTAERAATVDSLGEALKAYALKYVSGDGRSIDLARLKADALALKGEVLGSCGLAAALAMLAEPKPEGQRSLLAEPTPEQWREAFVAVRTELGVGAVRGG